MTWRVDWIGSAYSFSKMMRMEWNATKIGPDWNGELRAAEKRHHRPKSINKRRRHQRRQRQPRKTTKQQKTKNKKKKN